MPAGATASLCKSPFHQGATSVVIPSGITVAEATSLLCSHFHSRLDAIVTIERSSGELIDVDDFTAHFYVLMPGDILGIRVIPQGGGGGGKGKNPIATILSVVAIAASIWVAPYLAAYMTEAAWAMGAAGGMTGFAGFVATNATLLAQGIIGAAFMLAGSFLVTPQNAAAQSQVDTTSDDATTTYAITGSSNNANRYGAIPIMLGGTCRIFPCHAAEPFTVVEGSDEYMYQIFMMYGPVKIESIKIGESPLTYYTDYTIEQFEGWVADALPTIYPSTEDYHQEFLSVTLTYAGGAVTRRTNPSATRISFDLYFTRGLYNINQSSGKKENGSVTFLAEYSLVNSGIWTPFDNSQVYTDRGILAAYTTYNVNDLFTYSGTRYTVNEQFTTDGGAGDVTPYLAKSSVYTGGSPSGFTVTGLYTSAQKFSYFQTVPDGQYDIRWTRTTADDTTGYIINGTNISAIRTIKAGSPISTSLPPMLKIAIRIKATEQLNGTIQTLNFLGSAYLPVYDPNTTTWTYTLTDNPAWAYLNVLRGPGNKYPIPDSLIDLATFVTWAAFCTTKGYKIDGLVDQSVTLLELLKNIAFCGRATPGRVNNLYTVIIDTINDTITQVITPRNSWNFEYSKDLPDLPHALRVQFLNKDVDYQQDERIVYMSGYDEATATRFETFPTKFITNASNAYQHGQFHLNQFKLRPEQFTVSMDIEAIRCTRGSRVTLVHDTILIGTGAGYIKSTTVVDNNITSITLDTLLPFDTRDYVIGVRQVNGTISTHILTTVAGETNVMVLTTPVATSGGIAKGDLCWVGVAGLASEDCIVTNVEALDEGDVRLTMRHYALSLLTIDDGTIPAFETKITRPAIISQVVPIAPTINSIFSDENVSIIRADGSLVPRMQVNYSLDNSQVSVTHVEGQIKLVGDSWISAGAIPTTGNVFYFDNLTEQLDYIVRLRSISQYGVASLWSTETQHKVVGSSVTPGDVTGLYSFMQGGLVYLAWTPVTYLTRTVTYVVKKGASFATAQQVGTPTTPLLQINGPGTYWVVAKIGLLTSVTPVSIAVTDESLVANVIASWDEDATGWTGAKTGGVAVVGGELWLMGAGDLYDVTDLYVEDWYLTGGVSPQGTYTVPAAHVIDIGQESICNVQIDYRLTGKDVYDDIYAYPDLYAVSDWFGNCGDYVSVIPEIRTYQSGSWGPWIAYNMGQYAGQKFEARLNIKSISLTVIAVVNDFVFSVDVPDRVTWEKGVSIPVTGYDFVHSPDFNAVPSTVVQILGASAGDTSILTSETVSGGHIVIMNGSSAVERNVNLIHQGY